MFIENPFPHARPSVVTELDVNAVTSLVGNAIELLIIVLATASE
jgi:hypothetical protein